MTTDTTEPQSFAEAALEMAGKSAAEAKSVGAVDRADDQVESMYDEKFRTANSPLHVAIWGDEVPVDLFTAGGPEVPSDAAEAMERCVKVLAARREAGTLFDADHKISRETIAELADAGYWGLLVDREYGGSGVPFSAFAPFLTRMSTIEPTTAGIASVHQCIGAVDPVSAFGTEEQKQRLLPSLASGERLSAFALTEPGAGSDLTSIATTATRDGDEFVLHGEKLFITNALPGHTIGLVCRVDDTPAVLIVDLPLEDSEQFHFTTYKLHALRNTHNRGMVFNGLRVPAENLLDPGQGDGLTIAYHGLNKGRVALCANASGTLRLMAASIVPWAHKRITYGQPIVTRELVQRRLGRLAGMIVGADALVGWTSRLLAEGYRGEMECVVAKVYGADVQKEAAIELLMKTHGGRSFLEGHFFGDYVHDFLAPSIYEGEGEMLSMALFKSLVKDHGRRYFEPLGEAMQEAGIADPDPRNPKVMWAVRKPAAEYAKWAVARRLRRIPKPELDGVPKELGKHVDYAATFLQKASLEISSSMVKHQLSLPDRQARIAELSQRIIDATVILAASLHAARQGDELVVRAADVLADELTRKLEGGRPTDRYFRKVTKLGAAVAAGEFPTIPDTPPTGILMDY